MEMNSGFGVPTPRLNLTPRPHLRPGHQRSAYHLRFDPNPAAPEKTNRVGHQSWVGSLRAAIIRDAVHEIRHAAHMENVCWAYEDRGAVCVGKGAAYRVFLGRTPTSGPLRVAASEGEVEVASADRAVSIPAGSSEAEVSFEPENPALWSPERPNLYRLVAHTPMWAGGR